MELKVGNIFECPEGHKAKIMWISEDKKIVAVECPREHLRKVVKAVGHKEPALSYRNSLGRKEKFTLGTWFFSSISN